MDEVRQLASDALKRAIILDWQWHSQEGVGDYRMDEELAVIVRQAMSLGVAFECPYPSFDLDAVMSGE